MWNAYVPQRISGCIWSRERQLTLTACRQVLACWWTLIGERRLPTIELLEEPLGVVATPGVLYSTNPQQALAEDGRYVLKGPMLPVVFAESVCYELANRVGLAVPPHGVCFPSEDGTPWFATKMLEHR